MKQEERNLAQQRAVQQAHRQHQTERLKAAHEGAKVSTERQNPKTDVPAKVDSSNCQAIYKPCDWGAPAMHHPPAKPAAPSKPKTAREQPPSSAGKPVGMWASA